MSKLSIYVLIIVNKYILQKNDWYFKAVALAFNLTVMPANL